MLGLLGVAALACCGCRGRGGRRPCERKCSCRQGFRIRGGFFGMRRCGCLRFSECVRDRGCGCRGHEGPEENGCHEHHGERHEERECGCSRHEEREHEGEHEHGHGHGGYEHEWEQPCGCGEHGRDEHEHGGCCSE
ncbi:MAG: hypothetical protein FWC11_02440 [Firmicutes bacterium]|nr:hypothetical protein [Bacillota bacterium]